MRVTTEVIFQGLKTLNNSIKALAHRQTPILFKKDCKMHAKASKWHM